MITNYKKKNLKLFAIFILTVSLSLIFIEQIIAIFLKLGSGVNYNSLSFKIGYFTILGVIIITYAYFINIKFIHSTKNTFVIFYTATIYIFMKYVFNNDIEFLPSNNLIVYADFILILLILHLLCLAFTWKKQKKEESKNFFIEDKLFKNKEIDNEAILEKLTNVVTNFKPEEAFSIGINAVWGYGKSSFLHRFKDVYKSKNSREIVFWYRIWKNKGEKAIIENFFGELKQQLSPYSGEISNSIDKYVSSILSLSNSDLNKILEVGKNLLSDNETLESFYDDINTIIKKVDRQIIILLDDLDRLETDEILQTLKLIRALSDFNNVIFIAGYDREYVIEKTKEKTFRANYLDKIFNVEINLLPFNSRLIDDELFRRVEIAFPKEIEWQDDNLFNDGFKNLFQNLKNQLKIDNNSSNDITIGNLLSNDNVKYTHCEINYDYKTFLPTYRDIKRFLNEFKFNASFIENKRVGSTIGIIISEYILLKLLTYKYRDVNTNIFYKIDNFFIKEEIDLEDVRTINFNNDNFKNVYIYDKGEEELKKIFPDYTIDDIKIIDSVLCRLFGRKPKEFYQKNYNSISKRYYTDIYIKNNLLNSIVSITDLQKAFKNNELRAYVIELTKKITLEGEYNLVNEIKYFIFDVSISVKTEKEFLDILKTLQTLLRRVNSNDNNKIIQFLNVVKGRLYINDESKFKELTSRVMTQNKVNGVLDFLFSDINTNIKRVKSGLYENATTYGNLPLEEKELKELYFNKLSFLIKEKDECNNIYSNYLLYIEAIVNEKRILFSSEANKLLKEDIEERFSDYFNSKLFESLKVIKTDDELEVFNGYTPLFSIAQIFSNYETLNKLIASPQDTELYNNFYKEGWEKLLAFFENGASLDNSKIDELDAFIKAKNIIKMYIINDCQPIDKRQYKKAIEEEDLPF
ncbi:KAP family P-loop NTPase fold protein [Tenacibaculum ovolyticum]|uniref:KAP family P-loop NTPase fold protein n=1 Tax=Tenacibaculum ovolyticum TaxID=104270 RepID=UPI000409B5F2|nr:P-loop NTPase fold protein [Tenacibaculum ovolyticum]